MATDVETRLSLIEAQTERNRAEIERINVEIKGALSKSEDSRQQMHAKIEEVAFGLLKMELNILKHIDDIKTKISDSVDIKISSLDKKISEKYDKKYNTFDQTEKKVYQWIIVVMGGAALIGVVNHYLGILVK